jgi:hypothetical protein
MACAYETDVKPTEREIREAKEQAEKHAEHAARAKVTGTDLTAEPERPRIYGKARLHDGQFLCQDPKCPQFRSHGGPVRNIVEWVRLRDAPFMTEALEVDGETVLKAREYAVCRAQLRALHAGAHRTRMEAR